ncbi:MAG TPA: hypothetical protein VGF89_07830 [Steroidobacteraceae bacterium]|jgi:alkyl hydroperoxide reductase subunit AhpC
MATLFLGEVEGKAPLLRDWLGGDWGLLFSHPEDFQDQGLEIDRWQQILRDEFRLRAVRPLACRRDDALADRSWVGELVCDHRSLRLDADLSEGRIDSAARRLREQIRELPARFVLIIDAALNRRGVLKYVAGRHSISPLDLLAAADAMRRRPWRAPPPDRRLSPVPSRLTLAARAVA